MNDNSRENLRDLFERFGDSAQAENAVDDIERGDELLRAWPAPQPNPELLSRIKSDMLNTFVHSGRRHFRWFASRAAGIAAAFLIIASIWTWRPLHPDGAPGVAVASEIIPMAIWEGDDISVDDLDLAAFTTEVERIENEMKALLLGENGSRESQVDQAEMELLDIKREFWKG
ncbi:MAG: hypothetical protein JW720_12600 [Sedimentisphaerales bacterium]|nr:hypothetical protein [Sedimentisphaerales bacterium]